MTRERSNDQLSIDLNNTGVQLGLPPKADNLNWEQRQKIFEDIIIQRIKTIQNFCKKHITKLRQEMGQPSAQNNSSQPVVLSSIHNDGMALELKIKDIVKWKMEAIDQKLKSKDEKTISLELALSRQEKQFKETVTAISDATQQEFDKVQVQMTEVQQSIKDNSAELQERLMHSLTQNIMSNLLPQVQDQILEQNSSL